MPSIGLLDCNNFFVACEVAFNPKLRNKPVVVLSNNDGCCVSRSQHAKAIDIPMGAPFFKIKKLLTQHNGTALSGNFELYGDMSARVMEIIRRFSPTVEQYSIDEAFFDATSVGTLAEKLAQDIRTTIWQEVGLPVSIGIASTKTLAKLASEIAKEQSLLDGVCDLASAPQNILEAHLANTFIKDIWGIGYKTAEKLNRKGLKTALDIATSDDRWIRKSSNVQIQKTALELRGTSCLPLEHEHSLEQHLISSRSFGSKIHTQSQLLEALSHHIQLGCQKLRKRQAVAQYLTIYLKPSNGDSHKVPGHLSKRTYLPVASNYVPDFLEIAREQLPGIFRTDISYKKVGVVFGLLQHENAVQQHLFETQQNAVQPKHAQINQALLATTQKYGTNKYLEFGTSHLRKDQAWRPRGNLRGRRFTTRIEEVIRVC